MLFWTVDAPFWFEWPYAEGGRPVIRHKHHRLEMDFAQGTVVIELENIPWLPLLRRVQRHNVDYFREYDEKTFGPAPAGTPLVRSIRLVAPRPHAENGDPTAVKEN